MALPKIDLTAASSDELEELQRQAAALIDQKKAEELEAKLKQMDALAAELGLSQADLAAHFGGKKRRASTAAPKYRNPADASQTWTGRGRRPKWVDDHLEGGGKLEELAIAA